MRKLDMQLDEQEQSKFYKRGMYEQYLRTVGKCITYSSDNALREYGESYAKAIGSVEATVNLTLTVLPGKWLLAGLFLASCFISMSIGTSVGTVVALVPIASGLAEHSVSGMSLTWMLPKPARCLR